MKRRFSKDMLGDDSISEFFHEIKIKKNHLRKPKLHLYRWTYNGDKFIYNVHPPPTNTFTPKSLGTEDP
jgi:hypothetical protein